MSILELSIEHTIRIQALKIKQEEKGMPENYELKDFKEVIAEEKKVLQIRRKKLFGDADANKLDENCFGIALSGGGIRSATINLGFLRTFNQYDILKRADYISTVSGGGYTGAYLQATLKNEQNYERLFNKEHVEHMRSRGEYLLPGTGWIKRWNTLVLTVGYFSSLIMSWISPAIILGLAIILYAVLGQVLHINRFDGFRNFIDSVEVWEYGLMLFGGLLSFHFIANIWKKFGIGISKKFNHLEAALSLVALVWMAIFMISGLREANPIGVDNVAYYLILGVMLFLLGFLANPNALSFHRFYRNQLTDAYLHFTKNCKNIKLKDLFNPNEKDKKGIINPYPLINTCLNLQASNDEKFSGTKTSDYFLLSPLYCGAKLTKYVSTKDAPGYKQLTLPAAITISAAAVNPGMGNYSNKLLSVFMTIINARLGFWINNPLKLSTKLPVWWPQYFYYELMSKIGTSNKMLNISDGGHIENLGVYELLRRQCRLIVAVDAGADPEFSFTDLENLTVRARNELGLAIVFREDQIPENVIRPRPSHGYSNKRFAVADVYQIWEEIELRDHAGKAIKDENGRNIEALINYEYQDETQPITVSIDIKGGVSGYMKDRMILIAENYVEEKFSSKEIRHLDTLKVSTMVYVKSSVTAPQGKPNISRNEELKYGTYKYKIYHPAFPHEPTSDQFFDRIQWESYYQLGQYIAADVLGQEDFQSFEENTKVERRYSIDQLIEHFDGTKERTVTEEVRPDVPEKEIVRRSIPVAMDAPPISAKIEEPKMNDSENQPSTVNPSQPERASVDNDSGETRNNEAKEVPKIIVDGDVDYKI